MNIKSLAIPTVLKTLNYEEILASNTSILKKIFDKKDIDWQPIDSDEYILLLQAFSYRELYFRNEINEIVKQLLLAFCSGEMLDHKVADNGIERLKGSKPYAPYEFELATELEVDYVIEKGLIVTDITNKFQSKLLENVTIKAGDTKASGVLELQLEINESAVRTELITNSLPYVVKVKALDAFKNGAKKESDEKLLERYLESFADKSTAGAEETYKSLVRKADKRVEDVKVSGTKEAVVKVYYYSENADALMHTRIEEKLSDKTQRPLTDKVDVLKVSEVTYVVSAVLKIQENQESAAIQIAAEKSLELGLKKLRSIGEMITLSEINDFLKVEGVKEVIINAPLANVVPAINEIGICNEIQITTSNI